MRIRSIKPEFWRSESIKRLSFEHRLLFIGLWSYVDDNGVGVGDFRQIAADLFPLEDDPTAIRTYVREGLATLSREGRISFYQVSGKPYIHITGWEHQRIDKPGKARYPKPDADGAETLTSDNPDPRETLATPSRESRDTLAPGTGEQGNRGTGERGVPNRGTSLAASPNSRTALEEISGTAHTPAAHSLLNAFASACRKRPPADVLRKLGPIVDRLLGEDYTAEQIRTGLAEWSRKGLGTHLLPEVVHEVVNSERGRHLRPVDDIPDTELTRAFLDKELGPDSQSPATAPLDIEEGDPTARKEWYRVARETRLDERRAEWRRRRGAQNRTSA